MKAVIFQKILLTSFQAPFSVPGLVESEISRNRAFNSKDRRELTTIIYDALRWRRKIWGDIAPSQISYEAVQKKLDECFSLQENPPLPKWNMFSIEELARELSFPTWILERWKKEIGFPEVAKLALALNSPAPFTVRVNTLKTDREKLKKMLLKEGMDVVNGTYSDQALILRDRKNVKGIDSFRGGLFEIQDEASQVSVLMSEVKPGMTVVDACTGAGGKALAFASLMKNEGFIFATDSDSRKLPELQKRAKRGGVKIIKTEWIAQDDPNPLPKLEGKADVVFVDPPCSALGTLRRRPTLKWELTSAQTLVFSKKQLELLERYSKLVKPSGTLMYVTCTLNKEENEDVVELFLKSNPNFKSKTVRTFRPDIEGTDGFFIARLFRET